jgi:hypothetical protein
VRDLPTVNRRALRYFETSHLEVLDAPLRQFHDS